MCLTLLFNFCLSVVKKQLKQNVPLLLFCNISSRNIYTSEYQMVQIPMLGLVLICCTSVNSCNSANRNYTLIEEELVLVGY